MAVDFETLATRAEKRAGPKKDFVMNVKDDEPIVVPYPDAIKSLQYEKANNLYDQLQILTGKDFGRILELVRGKGVSVVQEILRQMWDVWDDDKDEVPGGKEQ